MDESFELNGQLFEWDTDKARSNFREHSVSFQLAATAFMDSSAVVFADEEHSVEELRDTCLGVASTGNLLRVTFTERPPHLRIVSARVANRYDESRYVNGY